MVAVALTMGHIEPEIIVITVHTVVDLVAALTRTVSELFRTVSAVPDTVGIRVADFPYPDKFSLFHSSYSPALPNYKQNMRNQLHH